MRGRNPPSHGCAVPAPFRQGGQGDGGTDCHSQCAHWLRNDRGVTWGAVGHMGPALQPHIFVGQGPCALPWVRYGIGGRTESSAPTEAQQKVQWAGDRKGRPYESVTRGAVQSGIPSHGYAVPAPFRQGGRGTGRRIATGAKRPRNDRGGCRGCGTGIQKQVS